MSNNAAAKRKRHGGSGASGWLRERPEQLLSLGDQPCLMGIDEAGRGPVLGPMVYGSCFAPLGKEKDLRALGFADSKTLNEDKRDRLFEVIQKSDFIGWMVVSLSAAELSNKMMQKNKYNLNAISHDTAIEMVQRALDAGVNIKECYVDTVGDSDSYERKLKNLFPSIDFTVCKKADSIYPITSAASICAKVSRDREIEQWTFREPCFDSVGGIGSGYPADAYTKDWLAKNGDSVFGFPDLVRFSWSTTTTLLDHNAHSFKWEADEEEDESQGKLQFQVVQKPVTENKTKSAAHSLSCLKLLPGTPQSCSFFTSRNLFSVVALPK